VLRHQLSGPDRELAEGLTLLRRKLAVGASASRVDRDRHLPKLGSRCGFVPALVGFEPMDAS